MLPPPLWPLRTILFLPPTGALLSADKERVSDGLLFQLLGKVGRRRHKRQKVTRRWQQTAPLRRQKGRDDGSIVSSFLTCAA